MASITQKHTWSRQSLVPTLVGLAICYSLVYNYVLSNEVENSVNDDTECKADLAGLGDESPHCSELRLFRSWHETDAMHEESDASLLALSPNASHVGGQSVEDPTDIFLVQQRVQKMPDHTQAGHAMMSEADEVAAAEQHRLQEAQLRRDKFDELERQVRASLNQRSITPWAQNLMEEQKRMEDKSAALERRHKDRVLERWQADIDRLASKISAALQVHAESPWKDELNKLKQMLQHHIGVDSSTAVKQDENVFALRHIQLDKLDEALNQTSTSKSSASLAQVGSFVFDVKQMRTRLEFEMSSQAMQGALGKELAAEVKVRTAKLESSLTDLVFHHKAWEEKAVTEESSSSSTGSTGGSLRGAQGPGKQYTSKMESTTSKPAGFMDKRLHWSSVTKMSYSVVTGAAHDVKTVVSKSELRHLHWGGLIPKVTCVTAISYSLHTKTRMMYFIDNFKLQNYEGPKELVLVYSHLDTNAAKLVGKYADGFYIKGVAARDVNDFPSNKALRYGAWSADGDVVVRWEFEEWHDPKRLSMQVRAMAAASKPACVLQSTPDQSRKAQVEEEEVFVQETSLAGERSWMKVYWQPLPREESANAVPPPPAHLVHLDMSTPQRKEDESQSKPVSNFRATARDTTTPSVNVEVVPEGKLEAADKKERNDEATGKVEAADGKEGKDDAAHEWTMDECLNLDTNVTGLTSDTEAAIDKNLGHGMSKMFHKLSARRRDITQRLVLLCIETTMKSDMQEHIFKRQHVEQMLGIRNELDKHVSAVVALYTDKTP